MNKIALWMNVCADDWTAERVIIASNDLGVLKGILNGSSWVVEFFSKLLKLALLALEALLHENKKIL